jgi:hypothetical protein
LLYRSGLRVSEIPIIFRERVEGESKIPSLQVFRSVMKIIKLTFSRIRWRLLGDRG